MHPAARINAQTNRLRLRAFIFKFLFGGVNFDKLIQPDNFQDIVDIFVWLNENQLAVVLFKGVMRVNENIQSTAVKVGDFREIERYIKMTFFKKSIDVRFKYN